MALVTPSTLFPGLEVVAASGTVTAQSVCIPLSALTGLTAGEANPTTGNAVKLLYELIKNSYEQYASLATAAKSGRLTFTKGNQVLSTGNLSQPYSLAFTLAIPSGLDVADEP